MLLHFLKNIYYLTNLNKLINHIQGNSLMNDNESRATSLSNKQKNKNNENQTEMTQQNEGKINQSLTFKRFIMNLHRI